MTMMKRMGALALALVLSVSLLASCSGGTISASSGSGSSASGSSSAPTAVDLSTITDPFFEASGLAADTVVATVGDYEITADSLLYWLNYNVEYALQMGVTDIPWDTELESGTTVSQSMMNGALELAAIYRLIPEVAAKEGITADAGLDGEMTEYFEQLLTELGSEEAVTHYLWLSLLTRDLFWQLYTSGDCDVQLQDKFFGEGTDAYPTDAEVLAYAAEQGYYRAKHILLSTVDGTTGEALDDETVAQKKTQADELVAQLQGADDAITLFDELMNQYSEDPGLATSPDGYSTYTGQMVTEFETAALALKDGEISGVVESDFGYHIILRLPLDPADYRDSMVSSLMQDLRDQWLDEYGIETTEAYDQIDPVAFREKVTPIQDAAYEEFEAIMAAKEAEADSSTGDTSGSASASSSQG